MTKQQALAKANQCCPEEYRGTNMMWAIEDFIMILYDVEGCEIVERVIDVKEIEKNDK